MRGRGEQPFSHYRSLVTKTTPKPTGRPLSTPPAQQVGTQVQPFRPLNPALGGLKHAGGKRGGRMIRDREIARTRTRRLQQQQVATQAEPYVPEEMPAPPYGGSTAEAIKEEQIADKIGKIGHFHPGVTDTATQVAQPVVQPEPAPTFGGETFLGGAPQPGTPDYQQAMYNLAREQIQGQTRTQAEQMREMMGGQGFRAGESGIANKAIRNILRGGAQRLSQESRGMGLKGMQQKYGQEQDAMNLMLRLLSGQQQAQQGQWQPYWQGMTQSYS